MSVIHDNFFKFLADWLDLINGFVCLIGALACVALMQIILKERSPMVQLQRAAIGFLGFSLFLNATTWYPEWALVNGHRPTGTIINVAITLFLLVMVVRGRIVLQNLTPRTTTRRTTNLTQS